MGKGRRSSAFRASAHCTKCEGSGGRELDMPDQITVDGLGEFQPAHPRMKSDPASFSPWSANTLSCAQHGTSVACMSFQDPTDLKVSAHIAAGCATTSLSGDGNGRRRPARHGRALVERRAAPLRQPPVHHQRAAKPCRRGAESRRDAARTVPTRAHGNDASFRG